MTKYLPAVVLCAAALLLNSCGSSYPLFVNTTLAETTGLREYCRKNNIKSIEVQKADSLAVAARMKAKEGNDNEAYWMADAAATYYRLAVAKHDLAQAKKKIAELRKSLSAAREQLNTYKEVLNELENLRNP